MSKIIKSYKTEEERIQDYVRNPLESLYSEGLSGLDFVDPAAILAEAREEAATKVQEAYAEGLRRGEVAGEAAFLESIGEAMSLLEQLAVQLDERRTDFLQELERQILELVKLVTARVLQREAEIDTEVVGNIVSSTLERLAGQESVVVRVNPTDLENIVSRHDELLEQFGRIEQLDIVADESVESGGCISESKLLQIDAQLSSQLNILIDSLMDQSPNDAE